MPADIAIRLTSDAFDSNEVYLYELHGFEAINQLFEFQLHVVSTNPEGLTDTDLLMREATLVFEKGDEEVRRVHGMICAINDLFNTETDYQSYRLTFVPRAWRTMLTETVDIFLALQPIEVIKAKLQKNGLNPSDDFDIGRLRAKWPAKEFTVQYKETDLAFISRLCEHYGMSFFFEHDTGVDQLVIGDHNSCFRPIEGSETIGFYAHNVEQMSTPRVYQLEGTLKALPGRYVVRDYNYRTPGVDLRAYKEVPDVPAAGASEIIEYGTHFKTPEEGQRFARVRSEEVRCTRRVYSGRSNVPSLRAGATFTLEGHPKGDLDLLLTEVRHHIRQSLPGIAETSETAASAYSADFTAIPKETPFRPARVTPKPRVHGVVTGIIDAPAKGTYAEVDGDGRYKVKFMYDTTDGNEGQASGNVRMAQPHAGPGYGMHFPLRPGIEVILTCVDGDPDRPIISGTVPNPATASPVTGSNNARNIIRTGGGNEMNFDDEDGNQRLKISIPHASTAFQLGSPNSPDVGATLTTMENFSTVANASTNVVSKLVTTVGLVNAALADKTITHWAGSAKKLGWWDKASLGLDVISGLMDTGKAAVEVADKWKAFKKGLAEQSQKEAKKAAAEKLKALKVADASANFADNQSMSCSGEAADNTGAMETAWKNWTEAKDKEAKAKSAHTSANGILKEVWEQKQTTPADPNDQIDQPTLADWEDAKRNTTAKKAEFEAAQNKTPQTQAYGAALTEEHAAQEKVDAYKAPEEKSETYENAKKIFEWGKKAFEVAKAGKELREEIQKDGLGKAINKRVTAVKQLFSFGAKVLNDDANLAAMKKQVTHLTLCNVTLKTGRITGFAKPIATPYYMAGADKHAAVMGKTQLFLAGGDTAVLTSGGTAAVAGVKKALVHSDVAAEVSSIVKTFITSTNQVNVKARNGDIVMESAKNSRWKVGGNMDLKVVKNTTFKIEKNWKTTVTLKTSLISKDVDWKVDKGIKIKATKMATIIDTKYDLKAAKIGIVTKDGSWHMKMSQGKIQVEGPAVGLKIVTASAKLYKGPSSVIAEAAAVKISAPQVKISGSGGVTVNGAMIKLG